MHGNKTVFRVFFNEKLFHHSVLGIKVHNDDPVFTTANQVPITDSKFKIFQVVGGLNHFANVINLFELFMFDFIENVFDVVSNFQNVDFVLDKVSEQRAIVGKLNHGCFFFFAF